MTYAIVRHKVEDYDKWKEAFDAALDFRKDAGEKHFLVCTDCDDKNIVTVMVEWEDLEIAKKFFESDELKEKMKETGVTEEPEIRYVEEQDKG